MPADLPAEEVSVANDRAPEAEHDWISEGLQLWLEELRLFVRTALGLALSPRQFAADWVSGRRKAMNPLAFLAATWPILLPADYGLQRWLGWDRRPNVSFWIELARSLRPYLFALPAALLAHAVFRLAGSRRRLSSTLGVFLYAMAFIVLGWVLGLCVCLAFGFGQPLPMVASALFIGFGAFALEGVHRIRWWWCALVFFGSGFVATYGINVILDHAHLS